jgi:radical SAM protein with 4Fe4S-binding SPASM domain
MVYIDRMKISKKLFSEQLSANVCKELFKDNIECIELGISSYCNRVCSYCPNSFVDRRSKENQMSDTLFFNILSQLKDIEYSGTITIHRYNEPFSDFEYALNRISAIKEYLPGSKLQISTNGDYINSKNISLIASRLNHNDSMHITVHFPPNQNDYEKAQLKLMERILELNLPYENISNSDKIISYKIDIGNKVFCEYRVINFFYDDNKSSLVNDRGGTLKIIRGHERVLPCFTTFVQMQIDWDGSLQPCCNVHSSVPEHKKFGMGYITENSDIFLVYGSKMYAEWRNSMYTYGEKKDPCTNCTYRTSHDGVESQFFKFKIKASRRLLGLSANSEH